MLREDWQDPRRFAYDNFKVDLEPWVLDVYDAYRQPGKRRVAMQAAVGVGKSANMAMLAWHFFATAPFRGDIDYRRHEGKYPVGYALSISGDNLKSGLWKELGTWYGRSDFLQREFLYSAEQVVHRGKPLQWWLRARSYAKSADPEVQGAALSGLHGPWVFIALDEVGEMHTVMGRRAEQALSDVSCEAGVILAAGNPTSTTGLLYEIASAGSGWKVVRITGDPDDPRCSKRTDHKWANEQIKRYGRENPWVMSHILGLFPPGGLNTLLSVDEVREAMENRNPPEDTWRFQQRRLGIDVARFGDDRTVIFPRQGLVAFRPAVMRAARTDAIAARVLHIVDHWGSEREFVDDSGHWGHGVVDALLASDRSVRAVLFEDPPIQRQYYNRRAEMWYSMAEWVKRGGSLPNIPEMIPELTKVQYGFQKGRIIIQPKEDVKKAIGVSPDLADALALTFAEPDVPSKEVLRARRQAKLPAVRKSVVEDYDPFKDFSNL